VLEHVTPKVILFYADSASHQNIERSLCTEKDKDKFNLWVLFANTMAVFLALTSVARAGTYVSYNMDDRWYQHICEMH
jgi:hypothetical protein